MPTSNLGVPTLVASQANKIVFINEAFEAFDRATQGVATHDAEDGDLTLTVEQFSAAYLLDFTGAPGADRNITLPANVRRSFGVRNSTGRPLTLQLDSVTDSGVELSDGAVAAFVSTTTELLRMAGGDGGDGITPAQAARLLPTFPDAGSRDDLIPKFDGDTLGWEADATGGGGAAITVENEGTALATDAETLNFTGTGVTVTNDGTTASKKVINIPAAAGGAAITVEDEGTALATAAGTLNFAGDGVTVTNDGSDASKKLITIPGGSSGGTSGGAGGATSLYTGSSFTLTNDTWEVIDLTRAPAEGEVIAVTIKGTSSQALLHIDFTAKEWLELDAQTEGSEVSADPSTHSNARLQTTIGARAGVGVVIIRYDDEKMGVAIGYARSNSQIDIWAVGGGASGAGGYTPTVSDKIADYTVVNADQGNTVRATGSAALTFTLPDVTTPISTGWWVRVVNASSAVLTIDGNGADTIDGGATLQVAAGDIVTLQVVEATAWVVLTTTAGGGSSSGGSDSGRKVVWGTTGNLTGTTKATTSVAVRSQIGELSPWYFDLPKISAVTARLDGGSGQTAVGYVQDYNISTRTTGSVLHETGAIDLDGSNGDWYRFEFTQPVELPSREFVFGVRRTDGTGTSSLVIYRDGSYTVEDNQFGEMRAMFYRGRIFSETNEASHTYPTSEISTSGCFYMGLEAEF